MKYIIMLTALIVFSFNSKGSEVQSAFIKKETITKDKIGIERIEREVEIHDRFEGKTSIKLILKKLSGNNYSYRIIDQPTETLIANRNICKSKGYDLPGLDSDTSFTGDTIFAFPCQRDISTTERASAQHGNKAKTLPTTLSCNTIANVNPPGIVEVGTPEIFEAQAWFETGYGVASSLGQLFGMIGSYCGFSQNSYVMGNGGGADVFVIRACRIPRRGTHSMNATSEICGAVSSDYQTFIAQ